MRYQENYSLETHIFFSFFVWLMHLPDKPMVKKKVSGGGGGDPNKFSFLKISQTIYGFRQNNSQGL